jgi:molybdopterin biosynthesis enzyme
MSSKWTKLAAAGALSLCTAVQALAGSVTQPGETVGLNTGAPLPQGWYAINTVDWGCMEHQPAAHVHGTHYSGHRLVHAVDDFWRESTVTGGVACGGSRRATRPRPRFARHLL